jgi:hypothetical protein
MSNFVELNCPFCGEGDFDDSGLKIHLTHGHCDAFERVEIVDIQTRKLPSEGNP